VLKKGTAVTYPNYGRANTLTPDGELEETGLSTLNYQREWKEPLD
jgi:hypothetical protein